MIYRETRVIQIKLVEKQKRLKVVELQIAKHRNPGKFKNEKLLLQSDIESLEKLLTA